MSGWIKLHRKILDSPLWKDCNNNQRLLMITMLLKANHETKKWIFKGQEYEVGPGQFITSLKSLSDDTGLTMSSVQRSLLKLEKYNFSISKSTNKNRLITIVNWEKYQSNEDEPINKTIGDRQATDKQPITNKNIRNKEYKNNIIYGDLVEEIYSSYITNKKRQPKRTKDRIQALLKKYGEEKVKRAVARYKKQVQFTELKYIKESDGFFNEEYIIKYLDDDYKDIRPAKKTNSNFNNFEERNNNYKEIEHDLLGWIKK